MYNIEIGDSHYELKTIALNALYEVVDPELGINIVDLGLVYNISVENMNIVVTMTLSTPSCPMGGLITAHAETAIENVLPDYDAQVLTDSPDVARYFEQVCDHTQNY